MNAVNMLLEHCFYMGFKVTLGAAIHIHHSLAYHSHRKRYCGEEWRHSHVYILSHVWFCCWMLWSSLTLTTVLNIKWRCHSYGTTQNICLPHYAPGLNIILDSFIHRGCFDWTNLARKGNLLVTFNVNSRSCPLVS